MNSNAQLMSKAGKILVAGGIALMLLFPFAIHLRAHQHAQAYLAAHPELESYRIMVLVNPEGQYFLYHESNDQTSGLLHNREVIETREHDVYEAGGEPAPGSPPQFAKVLSRGYLSDFTRIPASAILISLMMFSGGTILVLVANRSREIPKDVA